MLQTLSLSELAGIRHGFFTRNGGVSHGVYASLNGGVGSNDAPEHVAENRARMAAALGVKPDRFITAYQIHSPDVVVADRPWTPKRTPARRRHRHAHAASRHRRVDRRLRAAAVRRQPGAGDRRRACRLARRFHRRDRSDASRPMEKLGAKRSRIAAALGPTISQPNYEVGPEFVERFVAADATNARFFAPSERAGHALFDLPGYIAERVQRAGIVNFENLGLCNYAEPERFFSYRRTTKRASPITAGISTPSR